LKEISLWTGSLPLKRLKQIFHPCKIISFFTVRTVLLKFSPITPEDATGHRLSGRITEYNAASNNVYGEPPQVPRK
jgi:hypothetical protein